MLTTTAWQIHKHTRPLFAQSAKMIFDVCGHFSLLYRGAECSRCLFSFGPGSKRRAPLAFVMCRQCVDVIDPGPSEFIRRSSRTVLHLYLCCCPLPGHPPTPVCLPLSSSMHYSFIILLQLPYRSHFGEDKTCHLWVESGEMMRDFKEEEEVVAGRGGGWV